MPITGLTPEAEAPPIIWRWWHITRSVHYCRVDTALYLKAELGGSPYESVRHPNVRC